VDEQGSSSRHEPPVVGRVFGSAAFRGILGALVVAGLIGLAVWSWKPRYPASARIVPDPSALIGTFVTLYGLFIGAFGALVGFLATKSTEKRMLEAFRYSAITFLAVATIVDFARVWDASNDLFRAATHGLSYSGLHDDVVDFQIYFGLNLAVGVFGLVVLSLLPRSAK
jgi:uncharacterized membrane protein YedE/YeeE